MSTVLLFAVLGASAGALYALGSLGIVLIFRGSGVINFASGAMGMVGTFAFWELHDRHGLPAVAAVVIGVLVSALLGWVAHLLMAPLKAASNLTRVVLTLALLVVITGAVGLEYPVGNSYTVASLLPIDTVSVLGAKVSVDHFLLILIAVVVTAVAGVVYRYTRFGLATSAVAENGEALATLGWSPRGVAGANWALGAALSGFAGILLAPITGLSVGLATQLLLPTLAAAVIGNLESFPLALIGGVAIGVLQAELQRFVPVEGVGTAVPFAAILIVIVLRGRGLPVRSYVAERLPRVTAGLISVPKALAATAAGIAVVWWLLPPTWVVAVAVTVIGAIVLASIVVVTGYAGQISLAQWAIAGCGGLVTAQLVQAGWPFVPAIIVGILSSLPIGLVVGLAALRARGMSLAIATLAFGVCVVNLVLSNNRFNGGATGLSVGFFSLFGLDLDATLHPRRYAVFVILVFLVVAVMLANLRRGRAGRRLLAVRTNERAASALGVGVLGAKLVAFCYAAMIASLGGILTVLMSPNALFTRFDAMTSVTLVANAVFGGVGYVTGPLAGGIGQQGGVGTALLNSISSTNIQYLTVIFGGLTALVIMLSPNGLVPFQARQNRLLAERVLRRPPRRRPSVRLAESPKPAASPKPAEAAGSPAADIGRQRASLRVTDVRVVFGGVRALEGVSFSLESGTVLGVIGPNGAGKTTLIDAITGFTPPTAGAIVLDDREIASWSARVRARSGLARTFQSLELFEDLTVHENVLVACDSGKWRVWWQDLVRPGTAALTPAAAHAIRQFQLESVLSRQPGELSHGKRRLLAIARAIAAGPRVLLLDEPAAGLDERERAELAGTIRRLAHEWGMAVLLIDHDLSLVEAVSDRMLALDFGSTVASGPPDKVRSDPAVRSSYLGTSAEEEARERAVGPLGDHLGTSMSSAQGEDR
ncbi:MAG: ABC transporter permease subunit [Streptosporangiaceae bacterium]